VVVIEDIPLHPDEVEKWRELLLPFGKEPKDVRQAYSMVFPKGLDGPPTNSDLVLRMGVFHVEGLPATMWMDAVITDLMRIGHLEDDYPYDEMEWRVIDGREVYYAPREYDSLEGGNEDRGHWFYPKGEALFYINRLGSPVTKFTLEDLLAELP